MRIHLACIPLYRVKTASTLPLSLSRSLPKGKRWGRDVSGTTESALCMGGRVRMAEQAEGVRAGWSVHQPASKHQVTAVGPVFFFYHLLRRVFISEFQRVLLISVSLSLFIPYTHKKNLKHI